VINERELSYESSLSEFRLTWLKTLMVSIANNTTVVKKSPQQQSSVVRRLARRSHYLKHSGGYLDYMQHYHFEATFRYREPYEVESLIHRLKHCQHTWQQEHKGDIIRFRGIGCGDRDNDPLCGSYAQIILSREASRQMLLVQEALEIAQGVKTESYGLKIVLPLVKSESERLGHLLFDGDTDEWQKAVDRLFKLASHTIKQWFPSAPFVLSLDFAGESSPTEPHYHVNAYILPSTLKIEGDIVRSEALPHWFNLGELELMRLSWRDAQNKCYNLSLAEADINIGYLRSEAQVYHWLRYLYRHSLSDIWRGWQTYDGNTLSYKYVKRENGKRVPVEVDIPREQLNKAFQRLEAIPKYFKRIRWYGSLSDGQRGKTMSSLGLERLERASDDDGEGDTWQHDGYFSFVRFDNDGVVLEVRDDEGKNTGQYLKVLDERLTYSPKGVKLGRRIVWVEPGGSSSACSSVA
jgi:hypothetical protein